MPEITYIDTGITGAPAAVEAFMLSLGWRPEGSEPVELAAHVAGFAPRRTDTLDGALVSFALIRSTAPLTLPAGVGVAPSWMTSAAVGGFAAVSLPRTATQLTIYDRMTDAELGGFEAALQGLTSRQRMSWLGATVIEIDRTDVRALAATMFGAERAAEILG
jgi:hypothetical protein